MLNKSFSGMMLILTVLACVHAHAQATITGGQGSWLYVDGSSGSDSNPGTSAKPLKTIQAGVNKALSQNAAGVATVLSIQAGVYREAVTMGATRTSAPLTIQAATAGTVYIDGADMLTTSYKSSGSVYAYPWTDSVKGCPLPTNWYTGMPPIVQANEMVFLNGSPLTQVMSASQLAPGTFFVNSSYQELDLDPPSGTDMSAAKVEVAARRTTLTVNGASNLVLSGLVLQHAASCMNVDGANINSGNNILIDHVQANWNNWGGLGVNSSSNVTLQNSTANYNGGVGFAGFRDLHSLFSNNESDYNNWRGEMVGLYDFAQGGTKLMHAHSVTVNGQRSYNNGAEGLWFDTDNMNDTVSGAMLAGNLVDNLQLEASQGPFTVKNSSFCAGGVGVNLINTAGVTLTGDHFYGNGGPIAAQNGQIFLSGKMGGRQVTNFETGGVTNVYTANATLQGNTFTGVGAQQFAFNTYLSGTDWSEFINSLQAGGNNWFDAANLNAFGLPGGKHVNFAGWQSASGDTTSSWLLSSAASSGCGIPSATYPDFNVYAHNAASYVSGYTMSAGTLAIPLQVKSFGFGTVTLSAPGLPSGVTASFSPATLVSGNSKLTLTAYSSATWQTVPVTIFATSGSRVHTITLLVGIRPGTQSAPSSSTASTATPAISGNPSTLSVTSGSSGVTTLSVSGFTSSTFKFSCSGLPTEAKCAFGVLKGSGGNGTLSLKITTTAPTTAKLEIPAQGGGSPAMLALAVPGMIAIVALFTTRRRYSQWHRMVALALVVSTGMFLSACGVTPGLGNHEIAAASGGPSSVDPGSGSSGSSGSGSSGSGSSGTSSSSGSGSSSSSSGSGSGSGSSSSSGSTGSSSSGSSSSGTSSSSGSGTSSGSGSTGSTSGSGSSGSGTTSGGSSGTSSSGSGSGSSSSSSGSGSGTGTSSSGSGSSTGSTSSSGSGSGSTSGSGSSSSSSSSSDPGTPTGTSVVVVTAVSGTQSAKVSLTLKVS